jgi:uncharacterized membrane protein YebE (DUF533 family)
MTFIKTLGITVALATLGLSNVYANPAESKTETQKSAHGWKSDANQDGKVSYEEFRAAGEKRMEKHFKRLDANGDGFIDQAEKQAVKDKWGEKRKVKGERCHKPDEVKTY